MWLVSIANDKNTYFLQLPSVINSETGYRKNSLVHVGFQMAVEERANFDETLEGDDADVHVVRLRAVAHDLHDQMTLLLVDAADYQRRYTNQ